MGRDISFDFKELTEFKKNLGLLKKETKIIAQNSLDNYARKIVYRASELTPIMWGNLKDHWKYKISLRGSTVTAYIINDLPYASFVEEGHKQSRRFLPGKFVNTPGGTKFQYMPWVKGQGIMLHAGWISGAWMFKRTMMELGMSNELQSYASREFRNKWIQIMGA